MPRGATSRQKHSFDIRTRRTDPAKSNGWWWNCRQCAGDFLANAWRAPYVCEAVLRSDAHGSLMVLRSSFRRAGALALLVDGFVLVPQLSGAQDTARVALPTVRVTGTRDGPRAPLELPYAVTLARPDTLAALRRAGVDELLFGVPGVALANRQNPAQDPRISIRGFGARSAFGVRGVRVLQDGIPATLPDGQTPVDALDIEGADRVEVIRGSASSLYGNAAGGVIDLRSARPPSLFEPYVRIVAGGSTPLVTATGAGGTVGDLGITSSITRIAGRGFRDHSDQKTTRASVRMLFAQDDGDGPAPFSLAARISDVSHAQSPGALTRALFDANSRQADALSVTKGAGKSVQQEDVSLSVHRALGPAATVDATAFASARTLDNPTTQAIIEVKRASGGASMRLSDHGLMGTHDVRGTVGVDVQWLNDDRQEYANCIGTVCAGGFTIAGILQKNQRELVGNVGPFVRGEVAVTPGLLVSAGVRSDAVHFQLRDRLITSTNPDDSGERTLDAVSPSAGVVWRATGLAGSFRRSAPQARAHSVWRRTGCRSVAGLGRFRI